MKRLLTLVLVILSVVYPLWVYFSIQKLPAYFFGFFLAGIALLKFLVAPDKTSKHEVILLLATWASAALIIFSTNSYAIKLYPVLISSFMAGLFATSLLNDESLIEKMAKLSGKTITSLAKVYTKKLTAIWSILLFINALIALYLAFFASTQAWALYCGLIAYFVFGLFIVVEIIYRRHFIAKYESAPHQ